ncbi:MAG: phosphoribosylformylglycinamidine synthase subunit PurQ, partial [Wenzhouxiangellaceae bacterium]
MAAAGAPGQDAALRATVESVALELCRALELSIPVGKDSLSMRTRWSRDQVEHVMTAPVSLNVSAFAPMADVRMHVTPALDRDRTESVLLLLAPRTRRLGGSALAQVFDRSLGAVPDIDDAEALAALFDTVQALVRARRVLALHDRSDGGLFTTVLEMALAGRAGVRLRLPDDVEPLAELFNEEIGLVLQVDGDQLEALRSAFVDAGLDDWLRTVGTLAPAEDSAAARFQVHAGGRLLLDRSLPQLHRHWHATSHRIQRLRDHPECADQELEALCDWRRPGLSPALSFERRSPAFNTGAKPRVAVLREQGVNGQREMAMAFERAGFIAVDVHMSDLENGRRTLDEFQGLAVCGGFSFGDVLGAGRGWARSILFNDPLARQFQRFFEDRQRFALGVCNGCQMLSALAAIIPGSDHWPRFVANHSRQFEARLSQVEIVESASILLTG